MFPDRKGWRRVVEETQSLGAGGMILEKRGAGGES